MNTQKKTKKDAILNAFYEYILITFPIGLYVSFEAIHKHSWYYLIESPEWGIAVIFLIFVSVSKSIAAIRKNDKEPNETSIKIFNLSRLIGIIASVIISFYSVLLDNDTLIIIRVSIFIITSIISIILFTISELIKTK